MRTNLLIIFFLIFANQSFALSRQIEKKASMNLIFAIEEAEVRGEDLKDVSFYGIVKTTKQIGSLEAAAELFKIDGEIESSVKVRSMIEGQDFNLFTLTASLAGAINAAESAEVLVIEKSRSIHH